MHSAANFGFFANNGILCMHVFDQQPIPRNHIRINVNNSVCVARILDDDRKGGENSICVLTNKFGSVSRIKKEKKKKCFLTNE